MLLIGLKNEKILKFYRNARYIIVRIKQGLFNGYKLIQDKVWRELCICEVTRVTDGIM